VVKEINRMVGGIDMLDAHFSPKGNGKKSAAGAPEVSLTLRFYIAPTAREILEQCL
jgi:hypothetical protein